MDNHQPDANPSSHTQASRGRTRSNPVSTHHRSSPTVSLAKDRTGNNRRSGLRNHPP
jgi:hypothetical protein